MPTVTINGSRVLSGLSSSPPSLGTPGTAHSELKIVTERITTNTNDSQLSLYRVARLPSNAKLHGQSRIDHAALGTATATMNIGIYNPPGRNVITNSATAINNGIVCSTAGKKDLFAAANRTQAGRALWEIAGAARDPGGELDIVVNLATGSVDINGAGDIMVEVVYSL